MAEIAFVTRILTHYRVPFHTAVRARLAAHGVGYRLLVGVPSAEERLRRDAGRLDWAEAVPTRYFGPRLCWQSLGGRLRSADLVVIGQENRLLANYPLHLRRRLGGGPLLAFFGHGRNHQAARPDTAAERFKRLWLGEVDWWFAYTRGVADHVAAAGFPRERITVVDNAVDTAALRALRAASTETARGNGAAFIGGLYPEKRLDFLIAAADAARAALPDFTLTIIGDGPDRPLVEAAAATRPWLRPTGPLFGAALVAEALRARVMVMPGLVGLAVLDAFALGLPMVTTDYPRHSPEFAYLVPGVNGVVVSPCDDAAAYGRAVAALLDDEDRRARMAASGLAAAQAYTIEAMADRFVAGALAAIGRAGSATRDRATSTSSAQSV